MPIPPHHLLLARFVLRPAVSFAWIVSVACAAAASGCYRYSGSPPSPSPPASSGAGAPVGSPPANAPPVASDETVKTSDSDLTGGALEAAAGDESHPEREAAHGALQGETGESSIAETISSKLAGRQRQYEREYAEGVAALEAGDRTRAHEILDRLLTRYPMQQRPLRLKLKLCREDGRLPEALAIIDRALASAPENTSLLYEKALILIQLGDDDGAVETIDRAIATGGPAALARYLRATILARQGDAEGALLALEEAHANGFMDLRRLEQDAKGPLRSVREEPRFQAVIEDLRRRREVVSSRSAIERHIDSMVESRRHFDKPPPENRADADAASLLSALEERLRAEGGEDLELPKLESLDQRPLSLEEHRGKPVVLHIWGTWSPIGRGMLDDLARLREAFAESGLVVVTLAYEYMFDERTAKGLIDQFVGVRPPPLPTAIISKAVAEGLGVESFPTTMFIGRDGKVYSSSSGRKDFETMKSLVEKLIVSE